MDKYRQLYDFAASLGALEGYVFPGRDLDPASLDDWVRNLARQYADLPGPVRDSIAPALSRTAGRAVHSLTPLLGQGHPHVARLREMITGEPPKSHDDFETEKTEKA